MTRTDSWIRLSDPGLNRDQGTRRWHEQYVPVKPPPRIPEDLTCGGLKDTFYRANDAASLQTVSFVQLSKHAASPTIRRGLRDLLLHAHRWMTT